MRVALRLCDYNETLNKCNIDIQIIVDISLALVRHNKSKGSPIFQNAVLFCLESHIVNEANVSVKGSYS